MEGSHHDSEFLTACNELREGFCEGVSNLIEICEEYVLPGLDKIHAEYLGDAEKKMQRSNRLLDDREFQLLAGQVAQDSNAFMQRRQVYINLFAAMCYHFFEQQISLFSYCACVYTPELEKHDQHGFNEFQERLAIWGIEVDEIPAWSKVQELKLITNTVKHGPGRSADNLRTLHPTLFDLPDARQLVLPSLDARFTPLSNKHLFPLLGFSLCISMEDLRSYASAVCTFWTELIDRVKSRR